MPSNELQQETVDSTVVQIATQSKQPKGVINPPCRLSHLVVFENDICPFSNEKSCKTCISTPDDLMYIMLLSEMTSHSVGIA